MGDIDKMELSEKMKKSSVEGKGSATTENILKHIRKGVNMKVTEKTDKNPEKIELDFWVIQGASKSDGGFYKLSDKMDVKPQQINTPIRNLVKSGILSRIANLDKSGNYQFKGGRMPIFITEDHQPIIQDMKKKGYIFE